MSARRKPARRAARRKVTRQQREAGLRLALRRLLASDAPEGVLDDAQAAELRARVDRQREIDAVGARLVARAIDGLTAAVREAVQAFSRREEKQHGDR